MGDDVALPSECRETIAGGCAVEIRTASSEAAGVVERRDEGGGEGKRMEGQGEMGEEGGVEGEVQRKREEGEVGVEEDMKAEGELGWQEDGNISWSERKSVWQKEMQDRLADFRNRKRDKVEEGAAGNEGARANASTTWNSSRPVVAGRGREGGRTDEGRREQKRLKTSKGGGDGGEVNVTGKVQGVQLLVDGDNSGNILK
eukprot:509796-Hanusia_phi.AAC.1